jgi:glycosyltransferase involved in cell wall biosynthesis
MHIAIILGPFLPVPPVLGGAVEKVHLVLARAFCAAGHRVTMISRRYANFAPDEVIDGIKHIRIPSSDRAASLPANLARGLRYAWRAAAALPPADITITNEFSLPLVLPRRKAGKIYVQVGRYPKYQMFLYFRADRLQAVSRSVAEAIAQQAPWLVHKIAVIGYAISDAYFCATLDSAARDRTVLFVGRIAKEKGIELLIGAFLRLHVNLADWRLRIIGPHAIPEGGDGEEYLRHLKALAAPLGNHCEFAGPIFDQAALIREYCASSVFVYPSLAEFGEALPLAPLEAMASGCAAVVSDLRCFDDYIEHDATGLRFDHRTGYPDASLAAQLDRLLTEPGLLERIASAGQEAAGRFRTEAIAAQMLDDFRGLLENGNL